MLIKSIKDQTLLLLVSLTLGVAIIFSVLAAIAAFVVEDSVIANFLDEQAHQIEEHYVQYGNLPAVSFSFVQAFNNLDSVPEWARAKIDSNHVHGEIFTPDKTHFHYRKISLNGSDGYLLAEVSKFLVVTHEPRLWIAFLLVFFIAIVVAVFLAVKFSQKIVDPVLALTNAVKSNENPAEAIRLPLLAFELGYLSDAMQTSFDNLNRHLEREKAFASNVSHELRTPLTVLKNSCLLIAQRGFAAEDLVQIKAASEQMENTVDVLLALARMGTLALQPCNILMAVEQAILRCHASKLEQFQIHLSIPQDFTLNANSNLLQLLFINLLRNAVEHASDPVMHIDYENGRLVFSNKAKFYSQVDVTKAGIKGEKSDGIGQGLYLVARIAEHFGWQIEVDPSPLDFRVIITPA